MDTGDLVLTAAEAAAIQKMTPLQALMADLGQLLTQGAITRETYEKRVAFLKAYAEFFPELDHSRDEQKSVRDVAILVRNFLQLLGMTEMYNEAPPPSAVAVPVTPALILPPGVKK